MKVVVTGKNSYIGGCIGEKLIEKGFDVSKISVREPYKEDIFCNAYAVVHCAALVHSPSVKDKEMYSNINYRLAVNLARLAKKSGVKHFVFLSTMSVYGKNEGVINKAALLKPVTPYGESKLNAEREIAAMQDNNFLVTVVRPPMVYGKGCPGNYNTLRGLALKLPVFPRVNNKRSMIYSYNLAYFICDVIEKQMKGVYMPANSEAVNTSQMVYLIANANGKKIILSRLLGAIVSLLPVRAAKKAFGSLYYAEDCVYKCGYVDFEKSVYETEG